MKSKRNPFVTALFATMLGNIDMSAGTLQTGNNGGIGSLGSGIITLSGSDILLSRRAHHPIFRS